MGTVIEIAHEETDNRGAFYFEQEGTRLAEMTYKRSGPAVVEIDHTEVNEKLRGLGASRRLLDAAVAWARASGTRISATCSYARGQFEKDASIQDVYER